MARLRDETYRAERGARAVYDELFAEYRRLHDYFGRGENDVMKSLRALRATRQSRRNAQRETREPGRPARTGLAGQPRARRARAW